MMHQACLSRALAPYLLFLVLFVALAISPAVQALTVQPRTFPELVQRADTIVVASVAGLRSAWSADGQVIYTFVSLTDLDVLKGDVPAATFELRMPGGMIGDQAQIYPGMPNLGSGQRYVLFIQGNLRDFFPLVGINQGLYQVIRDAAGQQRVQRADHRLDNVTSGVTAQLPTLSEFTTLIRNKLSSRQQETAP